MLILFVCTANQCRSPMATALAARHIQRRHVSDVTVASAGLFPGGYPATEETVVALKERGLDLSGHRSRQLTPHLVAEADLILTMTVDQAVGVTAADADVWSKTFTLVDAVRRAERPGGPRPPDDVRAWVAWMHAGRRAELLLRSRPSEDIADPTGASPKVHEQTRDRLDDLLGRLVERIV